MKTQKKMIIIMLMVVVLTGCGKKKIDVMGNLTVKFDGYDGYGTAELENEYSWEKEALEAAGIESIEGLETFAEAFMIENAVSYEVTPKDNLSNGDEVTVKAAIDQTILEDYEFELVAGSEQKFIVESLQEITKIDPFEGIEVVYDGVSSEGRATVDISKQQEYPMDFRYLVEPDQGLKNGDTVVVSISNMHPDQEAIENGYELIQLEKRFTVDGLMHYAENIAEIPDDVIELLKKQTEDIVESDVAKDNARYAMWSSDIVYNLENKTFLGNYFLYPKKIESAYRKNICYFVYKLDFKGKEDFSCYYTIGYYDILMLEDGTSSYDFDKAIKSNPVISKGFATYNGYENIDRLYNDCVIQNLEEYTYESTVKEQ